VISEPLKFVILGPGERSFGAWEVLSVEPRATMRRVLLVGVPALAGLALILLGETIWLRALSFVLFGIAALPFLRAREKGYLLLTDRRLVYYHRTSGPWQSAHSTSEIRLEDVSGVRAEIEKRWGLDVAGLYVLSTTHDALSVATFASAVPLLSSIPGLGRLFRDSNVGRDTLEAVRDLYAKVRDIRSGVAVSEGDSR
jgi:hypothetical protein